MEEIEVSDKISKQLFEAFMMVWGDEFNRLPPIFRYLYSYKDQLRDWWFGEIVDPEYLPESQMAYLSSISRLNEFCQKYVKPFWVPITTNLQLIIDLSMPAYPVSILTISDGELIGAHQTILFNRIEDFFLHWTMAPMENSLMNYVAIYMRKNSSELQMLVLSQTSIHIIFLAP